MPQRTRSLLAIPTLLSLALVTLAGPVAAGNPPGNNGTVKVDATPVDQLPDNESHPSCEFQVDFFGFDEGDYSASATFTLISPTVAVDTDFLTFGPIDVGGDPATGAGTASGIDANQDFDLNNYLYGYMGPDGKGAHVKLTVHAEGAMNADTKYKVFWVTGCEFKNTDT